MAERFDLDAIAADDALLDLLAAGDVSAFGGLPEVEDDPAIHLLAELRLAVEVDEPSFEMVDDAESFLAACAARSPDPFARRIATRTLAAGIAAVAALSVSGVAAAVTGDPLSPYEKVIEKVVDELSPRSSFPVRSLDGVVGSKAKGIKASKEIKAGAVREQTGDTTTVQPTIGEDLLANRLTPQRVPPRVPPKTETKVAPPLEQEQEQQPTEVEPTQPIQTEQPQPPETQTSQPVEQPEETQPPTQPPATPTPTPTTATTTPEQPAGEETAGSENGTGGTQGTQGGDTGPNSNQHSPDPQPTTPTETPTGAQPPGDEPGDAGPADEGSTGEDSTDEGKQDGSGDNEQPPVDDPFAAALIRNLLAVLNGVMVTPHG